MVANYSAAGLPLEGVWSDIEAMGSRFQVFTFDKGGDTVRICLYTTVDDEVHNQGDSS